MTKPIVAITIGQANYGRMMNAAAWLALETFAHIVHHRGGSPASKADLLQLLRDADACITSWDVAPLDADVLAAAPRLRAMAHMGGSVRRFVTPAVWERGIQVTSAAPALARDVAETTLGFMIMAAKRVWPLSRDVREGGWRTSVAWPARELHSCVIGLVGAGQVGRHVIRLLASFGASALLFDPFVSQDEAVQLGVTLVDLDDLVQRADIVSLHAPAKPDTHHLLNARRLALLKDDAVLVNTARGSLVDEKALIAELSKGRLFVFLDVTDPEPPAPYSPLRRLPNVVLTPHLAGCIADCGHMGEMAVEELRRVFAGEAPLNAITPEMLERIS